MRVGELMYHQDKESAAKKRILIFAPSFTPAVKAGGPARSITNLAKELDSEFIVDVITSDRDLGDEEAFAGLSGRRVTSGSVTIYYLDTSSPRQVVSLLRRFAGKPYDLIMLNSFWDVRFSLIPAVLSLLGLLQGPLLMLPRGELEPGSLSLKARKKQIAWPIFRNVYRRSTSLYGATSRSEASSIHRAFANVEVITTTNNVPDELPWGMPETPSTALRVTFFSRIAPEKGLLPLLRGLRHTTADIELTIAGPPENETYWRQCQIAISRLPESVHSRTIPFVPRDGVAPLLWNSDCLVLLTAAENYGHVIAESLQAGCPVITTPATPWTDVLREGGGEIIQDRDDAKHVAAVLDNWAAKTTEELSASRSAARTAYVKFAEHAGPNVIALALQSIEDD